MVTTKRINERYRKGQGTQNDSQEKKIHQTQKKAVLEELWNKKRYATQNTHSTRAGKTPSLPAITKCKWVKLAN